MAGKLGRSVSETVDHAGSKMLCIGSGSSITTTEDFVAIEQRLNQRHGCTGDGDPEAPLPPQFEFECFQQAF